MIAIIKPRKLHFIPCTFTIKCSCVRIWMCWFCGLKYSRSFGQNLYRKQDFERPGEEREKLRDKSSGVDISRDRNVTQFSQLRSESWWNLWPMHAPRVSAKYMRWCDKGRYAFPLPCWGFTSEKRWLELVQLVTVLSVLRIKFVTSVSYVISPRVIQSFLRLSDKVLILLSVFLKFNLWKIINFQLFITQLYRRYIFAESFNLINYFLSEF